MEACIGHQNQCSWSSWWTVLRDNPCPTPKLRVSWWSSVVGRWHCRSLWCALLVLGEEKDKQKPFHGGEHPSGARLWAIQCLINCADLKKINKQTQLFVIANEVAFS